MIDKEALQLLLYAQKFYPKEYANFVGTVAKNEVPWDFTNDSFVRLLDGFKQQFSSTLKAQESLLDNKIVLEQNVPMKDVVDPLVADLERAQAAQKEKRIFVSNNKKVKTYIEQSKKSIKESETVESLIQSAQERVQTAGIISQRLDLPTNTKGLPELPNNFFSSIAETALQKIVAPAIDLFANANTKLAVIQSGISKAREEIQKRTDVAGELLAGSPEVTQIIKQMSAGSVQGPQANLPPLRGLQNFFADAFYTVFFKPEFAVIQMSISRGVPIQTTWSQMSAYALSLSGATTKGVARFALKETGEKIITSSFGKSLGALLGSFLGPGPGTFLGWLIGDIIIDKALSFIGRGITGLFNLLSLKFLTDLFSGNVETTPVWKDALFLIPLALIAVVALMAGVIPSVPILEDLFPNSQKYIMTVDNAYIQGMGGGLAGQSGNNAGAGFSCTWSDPPPPTTSISVCPVHSRITQGPFVPNESHADADAYDFGSSLGTPIVAAHDGYVVSFVNSYEPGEYQYRSFGNNVVLVGTDADDNIFCTNYAHLLDVSLDIISAQGNQTIIHAGQQIGVSDTTGYTYGGTGEHLHFGYKGSGRLSLPAGCP